MHPLPRGAGTRTASAVEAGTAAARHAASAASRKIVALIPISRSRCRAPGSYTGLTPSKSGRQPPDERTFESGGTPRLRLAARHAAGGTAVTVSRVPARTPSFSRRDDLRNVAIVAHVDHGKTTLVDALLWQSG